MSKHLIIRAFIDKDTSLGYSEGDMYESNDSKRIAFLVEQGFLQENQKTSKFPKHAGGGWYELSNGDKIQGKDEAVEAERLLRGE
ncbi:hypothetical protein OCE55_21010 [Bacillus paranthracis]|uniref:hypothetical protein n=1 Tax=Bacillus cereus group TaxID=86661 RepID=UPI001E395705|nr:MULTISPECIES: hypothetical protein [Bacillus cereus group]MCC2429873.1 hypothetical protein [Bacillus paranthracis]MCU5390501.1 hypothetical protein [Bacillus paranthracis]MDA1620156.1 hypothetical protein [Bacillus cereus group sp. TH204-1LC]